MRKSNHLLNILTIIIASIGGCAAALSCFIIFYSAFFGKSISPNSQPSFQDVAIIQNDYQPDDPPAQLLQQEDDLSPKTVAVPSIMDTDSESEMQSFETYQTEPTDDSIPLEYYSALNRAIAYSDTDISKADIYDQLVSEYGDNFSAEAAQYAVDHVTVDWNPNTSETTEDYQDATEMSPDDIQEQIYSEYDAKFTPEEAETQALTSKTVWLSATGSKFHCINNCGNMNPNSARQASLEYAINMGYEKCSNCY